MTNKKRKVVRGGAIRVRTKRLDQIDGDKIALAYWLLAKQIVANETDTQVSQDEARRVAGQIDPELEQDGSASEARS